MDKDPSKTVFMLGIAVGQAMHIEPGSLTPECFHNCFSAYCAELDISGFVSLAPFIECGIDPANSAGQVFMQLSENAERLLAAFRASDALMHVGSQIDFSESPNAEIKRRGASA